MEIRECGWGWKNGDGRIRIGELGWGNKDGGMRMGEWR